MPMKNLEQYKGDLERLIEKGVRLQLAMRHECDPEKTEEQLLNGNGR